MKITDYSFTKSDVLGKIPFINQIGLDNLCDSGRLKRKKVLGVWKYCRYSVKEFLNSFNVDDYYKYGEVVDLIKEYGIEDEFEFYGRSKKNKPMCVYKRKNSEFPLSVKNLINYGYMKIDEDISPILITKESVEETIKLFKVFGLNNKLYTPTSKPITQKPKKNISQPKVDTPTPSNNSDFYQRLLEKIEEKSS